MDQLRVPDRERHRASGLTKAVRVVEAGEGALLRGGTHQLKVGIRDGDTAGALTVWVSRTNLGKGPPLHLHEREDELFYVLSGRYELTCGAESLVGEAGCTAFMPRLTPHRFRAVAPETPCRLLHAVVPGGFEEYLASITDSEAGTSEGRELRRLAGTRFGIRFPEDPRQLAPGAEREPPPRFSAAAERQSGAADGVIRFERFSPDDTGGRLALDELTAPPGADWRLDVDPALRVAYVFAGELELDDGAARRRVSVGATAILPPGAEARCRNVGAAALRILLITALPAPEGAAPSG